MFVNNNAKRSKVIVTLHAQIINNFCRMHRKNYYQQSKLKKFRQSCNPDIFKNYNGGHIILRLFGILPNVSFLPNVKRG